MPGSDPVSEALASDDGADANFEGVAAPRLEGVGPKGSVRLAHGAV